MRRLATLHLLLVALPALAGAAGVLRAWAGYREAIRQRSDQKAAEMAVTLLRLEMDALARRHAAQAPALALPDTTLPAVRAALRGETVAELAAADDTPAVKIHVPRNGGVAGLTLPFQPEMLRTMEGIAGYEAALYFGRRRIATTDFNFGPDTLPATFATALVAEDRTVPTRLPRGRRAAVAPLRDADEWEIIGALAVAPSRPPEPLLPLAVIAGTAACVALMAGAAWSLRPRTATRRTGRGARTLRLLALLACFGLLPGAAVAWLDAALRREADETTAARLLRAAHVTRAATEAPWDIWVPLRRPALPSPSSPPAPAPLPAVPVGAAAPPSAVAPASAAPAPTPAAAGQEADALRAAGHALARLTGEDVTLVARGEPVFTTLADTTLARRLTGRVAPARAPALHGRVAGPTGEVAYAATRLADGSVLLLSSAPLRTETAGFRFWGIAIAAGVAVLAAIFYSLAALAP